MTFVDFIDTLKQDKRIPLALMGFIGLYLLINTMIACSYFFQGAGPTTKLPSITTDRSVNFDQQHLFGFYLSDYDDLPETQLQLTLEGTAIDPSDKSASLAIIGAPNQESKTYHIGQGIPDGASIHAIEKNRVIIDDNGELERLSMPIPKLKQVPVIPGLPMNSGLRPG